MVLRFSHLTLVAFFALSGCGLKGPLYLPEAQQQTPAQSDEERKERTKDSGSQTPAAPTDTTSTPPASTPPSRP